MRRLPFLLPDFTRRQWASPRAREVWEPRLNAIGRAWAEIERESVAAGIRSAHLCNVTPGELPAATGWAASRGLALLPMRILARAGEYSATTREPAPGEAWDYRAVYLLPELAAEWTDAWGRGDDPTMGGMLGYPECCSQFFQRVWVDDRRVDTTWAMCGDPDVEVAHFHHVDPLNQILGRWAGYRAVPHLPCSWDCEPTREFGRALLNLGREIGHAQEMDWLEEALSWPHEWSALHGIAEVRSPILRISTRTDATPTTYTVRIHADSYPEAGARGTRFPFRTWREERRKMVQMSPPRGKKRPSGTPAANGFATAPAMDAAHAVLIQAAAPKVGEVSTIVDLGAGDGTLLARLGEALGAEQLRGVEIDELRAGGAVSGTEIVHADIRDVESWDAPADLVVLMPGRLEEMETVDRDVVAAALAARARMILAYAYGDWLDRAGGLAPLVDRTLPRARLIGPEITRGRAAAALYSLN